MSDGGSADRLQTAVATIPYGPPSAQVVMIVTAPGNRAMASAKDDRRAIALCILKPPLLGL